MNRAVIVTERERVKGMNWYHPWTLQEIEASMSDGKIETHPVQTPQRGQAVVPTKVTMLAYEVYCHVFGAQSALVTGWCRGGFSTGELIAFLYARSFPKEEWKARTDEAFKGMENL